MPRKIALIIGNDAYQKGQLQNCVNDASSLAKVLRSVGCEVNLQTNLKSEEMYECIKAFAETIQRDDFVIFFFAGHGLQWGDQNFLMPCDNHKIASGPDMQRYAVNAQQSLDQMANMEPHFILFLLDCCREYWLPKTTRSGKADSQVAGLNKMTALPGTLIAFACAAGQTTSDQVSDATNGLFTKSLLKHIITPGVDIQLVLRRVANDVAKETNHTQIPFQVSSILTEDVLCLVPADVPRLRSRSGYSTVPVSINRPLNILLIGEKNVGKTTFINAFVNYLSFKTFQEAQNAHLVVLKPLSFYVGGDRTLEGRMCTLGNVDHPDSANTSQCHTYTFDPCLNDRKILQIIDTPSLEDTTQQNQNKDAITQHILDYVNQLSHINAVCFLLQPDTSRLSTTFQTCFAQLINRLGQNARNNVVFCFTNALLTFSTPGSTASLVRKMFASHSLNDIPFSRNNSFFFENESFRYLVAAQNGVAFSNEDRAEYSTSWPESVQESTRLLDYIRGRSTHYILKR